MAFLITAVVKTDTDTWTTNYLNEDQSAWIPTQEGAFQTESWTVIENIYNDLIQQAHKNAITGRSVSKLLQAAFAPLKEGKLVVYEQVLKEVLTTHRISLK